MIIIANILVKEAFIERYCLCNIEFYLNAYTILFCSLYNTI